MLEVTSKIDIERRGLGVPQDQRELVECLRAQAFEVQRRFVLAEQSALLLQQMLDVENGIAEAANDTYEAHAFNGLRMQLFRLLIVDLYACVLDRNPKTGSVRSILKQLRRDKEALDALTAYYSETDCLDIAVRGDNVTEEVANREILRVKERYKDEHIKFVNDLWESIDAGSEILRGDHAKRMVWARHKAVAHFDKSEDSIVALHDDPEYGEEKLTWGEPIKYFEAIRPYVYDVFLLLTSTSWDSDMTEINRFYAKAFWDRFKNGKTDLKPEF